jgi:hypothetical protein
VYSEDKIFPLIEPSTGAHVGNTHGASGEIAFPEFRHAEGKEKTGIFWSGTTGFQSGLRADGEDFRRGDRDDRAVAKVMLFPICFFVVKKLLKADRETPSIADEVTTLLTIAASRSAGSFR